MAYQVQGGQDVDDPCNLGIGEADSVVMLVEAGDARQTAQDERAPLEGGQHVLVDEVAQGLEAGDDGFVPTFVALHMYIN